MLSTVIRDQGTQYSEIIKLKLVYFSGGALFLIKQRDWYVLMCHFPSKYQNIVVGRAATLTKFGKR